MLGADLDSGVVPEGLAIIQVGDLVHKGPDSGECFALADRFLVSSPGRWVQLVGNHEAQYLGGTPVAQTSPWVFKASSASGPTKGRFVLPWRSSL